MLEARTLAKEIPSNETFCSIRCSFLGTIRSAIGSSFIPLCHSMTVLEDEQAISLAVVGWEHPASGLD